MKKIVSIICVCMFISFVIISVNQKTLAATSIASRSILPNIENIKEMKKLKEIKGFKEKPENLMKYLNNLSENELLLAIAECSVELEKSNSISELSMFAEVVDKKLTSKLQDEDYIAILNHPEYSDAFKIFMIDTHSYSKYKKKEKNSTVFNYELKKIIKNKDESESLRFQALKNIDSLSKNDLPMLDKIMASQENLQNLKAAALDTYNQIDNVKGYKLAKDIVINYNKFTQKEVVTAMQLISRTTPKVLNSLGETNTTTASIDNVVKTTKNRYLIEGGVFALGNIRDKISVKAIVSNKNKINDDSLILFYTDMNFITINNMLSKGNNSEDIQLALQCVEVSPFKDFLPNLQTLVKDYPDDKIKKSATFLVNKINENNLQRTTKWDNNK